MAKRRTDAAAREAVGSAGSIVSQGTTDVAAVQVSPPAAVYEALGLEESARPGWFILKWRHAGVDEVIRTNVSRPLLQQSAHTTNPVLRQLYEFQLEAIAELST